ncbi:radical SAM peptide maturase, CXXX-repeat target family [Anaerolentibacter hominis]|uniref:radical SAM peptide maturase, CXXX-repeat target family n=1 Tax=Anaerolentibacter hominis TaxID=3079009 RepID=UPI0031B7EFC2
MSKRRKLEQYQDMLSRLYPDYNANTSERCLSRTVTFQTSDACNLACSYCYQINKGHRRMSFDTAKKFVDLLLSGEKGMSDYIRPDFSPGIVLEFIGGEPLLEIELTDRIMDYFLEQAIEKMHPWATNYMISICSNGVLYFDEKVQRFLQKHKNHMSFSITIDGNRELHDSCRLFPDGRPSYDLAVAGANDWIARGNYMGSKITVAPENLAYLYDAIVHMVDLGYDEINANCVYEKGWESHHATEFYWQLKKIADYWNEHDLVNSHYCSLFVENFFQPKAETDLDNWCGGTGFMLSCDPDGYLYPCIRYMESSLGADQPAMRIGHVDTGIGTSVHEAERIQCLKCIDRRSQSSDECFSCPIAEGCSWCSAYNYQEFGTPDHRATYICDMHKARALANYYFWTTYYKKHGLPCTMKLYVPEEWALAILPREEWDMLCAMSPEAVVTV